MNRNVPLLPTTIFLLLLASAIWLYASKVEEISPTVVQQVVRDAEGTTWALFGDTLIDIADEKANSSFIHHGFDAHVGQVIPLASGEWILNIGAQSDYVKKAIVRSMMAQDAEYQSSGSLLKCSATLEKCLPWGEAELQFERAFDGLELGDGKLLLFKAEKQRIFLVDANGFILDEVTGEELWFGAEPITTNSWVGLNTERTELTRLQIKQNKIFVETLPFDFYDLSEDGDSITLIGPSKMIVYNGKYWCLGNIFDRLDKANLESKGVSSKEALMENLADMTPTLINFDADSGQVWRSSFKLNAAAEIERIEDAVYFSDFYKYEIKRFDLSSESMSIVESAHLQTAFEQDEQRVREAKSNLYQLIGLIGLGALAAFIWLVIKSTTIKTDDDEIRLREDVLAYGLSDDALNRELAHIARVFAKTQLTKTEAATVGAFKHIDGDYIYYPRGIYGKGRVVSNAETLVGLFKWQGRRYKSTRNWVLITFIGVAAFLAFFDLYRYIAWITLAISVLAFVIGLVVIPIIAMIERRALIKDLLEHHSRLTFLDVLKPRVKAISPKWVWLFIVGGLVPISFSLTYFLIPQLPNIPSGLIPIVKINLSMGFVFLFLGIALRWAKIKLSQKQRA